MSCHEQESDPLRIELFGDLIESIRFFSVRDQKSIKPVDEAIILPAREAVLRQKWVPDIINRVREYASNLEIPARKVRDLTSRLHDEGAFPGIESLMPLIYPSLDCIFDYIPENAVILQDEPGIYECDRNQLVGYPVHERDFCELG